MKKLVPNPKPSAEVWVPEDGIDRRTAASIEPAFQALLDRAEALFRAPPRINPWKSSEITLSSASQVRTTNTSGHLWFYQATTPQFVRVDLATMEHVGLTPPATIYSLRVNQSTETLILTSGTSTLHVYRSTDDGDTWTQVLTGSASVVVYIAFNGDTAIMGGKTNIWLSSDDGQTWTAYTANEDLGTWYDAYWYGGRWWVSSSNGIFWSTDGQTWTQETGTWSQVLSSSRFVEHSGVLYLPVKPLATWDGAAFEDTGISNINKVGAIGGRLYYWTGNAQDRAQIDYASMQGSFAPEPAVMSDTLMLWYAGLAI